jgi:hypothetical protein
LDCVAAAALSGHTAHVFGRKWQERKMSRAFDCHCQLALVPRTRANFATRANLAAIRQIAAQLIAILVINEFVFVFAVDANPTLLRGKPALSIAAALTVTAAIGTRTARTARATTARTRTAA